MHWITLARTLTSAALLLAAAGCSAPATAPSAADPAASQTAPEPAPSAAPTAPAPADAAPATPAPAASAPTSPETPAAPVAPAASEPVANAAPAFTLPGVDGASHSLADYRGKWVVLEWTNPGCPYVKKHYESGNMQALQKRAAADGVVWLTICSSAPGKEGYALPDAWKSRIASEGWAAAQVLLDPDGTVGRLYGAKVTPHMYVIDPKGSIVYRGAIDDKPTAKQADIAGAKNHVMQTLEAGMAGEPVPVAETKPYG